MLTAIRHVDPYHSCYCLAGLSSAQHAYVFGGPSADGATDPMKMALGWSGSRGAHPEGQATQLLHPVLMTSLDSSTDALRRRFSDLA